MESSMAARKFSHVLFALSLLAFPAAGLADSVKLPGGGTLDPAFNAAIPNIPGKTIVASVVTYEPGGMTPPHHHAKSAFVVGYVLSGEIRSQVKGGPAKVFKAGESWTEMPGAAHTVSENASKTKPAKLLAIYVVNTDETKQLNIIDGQ
jgi:quercetin dioxygenase-like cupin family protein